MSAILKSEDYGLWLDPRVKDPVRITGYLKPFDAALMKKYPVNTRVNHPENDDHECAQEVAFSPNESAHPCGLTPPIDRLFLNDRPVTGTSAVKSC